MGTAIALFLLFPSLGVAKETAFTTPSLPIPLVATKKHIAAFGPPRTLQIASSKAHFSSKEGASDEDYSSKDVSDGELGTFDNVFDESTRSILASEILSRIHLPLPARIAEFVVGRIVDGFCSGLSSATLDRIRAVARAEQTYSTNDNATPDEVKELADDVAQELIEGGWIVDIPLLPKNVEEKVLRDVVTAALAYLTITEDLQRVLTSAYLDTGRALLEGEEGRRRLVATINSQVDVPLLDEDAEGKVISLAVDKCAGALQSILPPELIQILQKRVVDGEEGLEDLKAHLVEQLDERIGALLLLPSSAKQWVMKNTVDYVVGDLVGGTKVEFFLMSDDEKREELQGKQAGIMREMEFSRRVYERELNVLEKKLAAINKQLEDLS